MHSFPPSPQLPRDIIYTMKTHQCMVYTGPLHYELTLTFNFKVWLFCINARGSGPHLLNRRAQTGGEI